MLYLYSTTDYLLLWPSLVLSMRYNGLITPRSNTPYFCIVHLEKLKRHEACHNVSLTPFYNRIKGLLLQIIFFERFSFNRYTSYDKILSQQFR